MHFGNHPAIHGPYINMAWQQNMGETHASLMHPGGPSVGVGHALYAVPVEAMAVNCQVASIS